MYFGSSETSPHGLSSLFEFYFYSLHPSSSSSFSGSISFSFLFFLHPAPYGSSSLSFREELAYNIHKKVFRVSRCLVFSRGSLKFLQCHRETLDSRSMCRDSGQIPPLLIFCQGFRICCTEFCLSFQMFLLTEARTPVFPFKNHSNVFSIIREWEIVQLIVKIRFSIFLILYLFVFERASNFLIFFSLRSICKNLKTILPRRQSFH